MTVLLRSTVGRSPLTNSMEKYQAAKLVENNGRFQKTASVINKSEAIERRNSVVQSDLRGK